MNESTGEIRRFASAEAAKAAGFNHILENEPNPNCKRCHGVGHTGKNLTTGKYVVCKCTYKTKPKK